MNKIVISLAVLAGLSSVALAKSDIDPRDREPVIGTSIVETAPLLASYGDASKSSLTAYERARMRAEINENGGN